MTKWQLEFMRVANDKMFLQGFIVLVGQLMYDMLRKEFENHRSRRTLWVDGQWRYQGVGQNAQGFSSA